MQHNWGGGLWPLVCMLKKALVKFSEGWDVSLTNRSILAQNRIMTRFLEFLTDVLLIYSLPLCRIGPRANRENFAVTAAWAGVCSIRSVSN